MEVKLDCGKGAENLTADEKLTIDRIINEYSEKIKRHISKIDSFDVHLKCHLKKGKTKRYTLEARLISGKFRFEVSADEYNLKDATHILMNKLTSEIEHKIMREKNRD